MINIEKHHLGKTPFRYNYDAFSYLTLGGWDDNDFNGTMTWYDTSATTSWNLTAAAVTFSDSISWTDEAMPTLSF